MTVSGVSPIKTLVYAGVGDYDFPFLVYDVSDLLVTHIDSSGIATVLDAGDYSAVTLAPDDGGTVSVTNIAYGTTGSIQISRVLVIEQTTDWVNNDPFNMELLERTQDEIVMMMQQINASIGDALSTVTWKGAWLASQVYRVHDIVVAPNSDWYVCVVDHNSTAGFTVDLASGYWTLAFDMSVVAGYASSAEGSAVAALASQVAAAASQVAAAASQVTAAANASDASVSASEALQSEVNAAASEQSAYNWSQESQAAAGKLTGYIYDETVGVGGKTIFEVPFQFDAEVNNFQFYADGALMFDAFLCDIGGTLVTTGLTKYVNAGSTLPAGTEVRIYSAITTAIGDIKGYVNTYGTIAALIAAATSLVVGQLYYTEGNKTSGDDGRATYLCVAGNTGDGYVNHNAGANTLVLQNSGALNVKQCGAVGDGIADDTVAIQAALDSSYLNIFIPKGNFLVNGTLWIKKNFQTFFGAGPRNSIITRGADTGPLIKVAIATENTYIETVRLETFSINNNIALCTNPDIQLNACLSTHVTDVRISGTGVGTALQVNGCLQLSLFRLYIRMSGTYNSARRGILFDKRPYGLGTPGNCGAVYMSHCEIDTLWLPGDATQTALDRAIHIRCMDGLMIDNSRFGGAYTANIDLDATDVSMVSYAIAHVLVTNCFFDMVPTTDVLVRGANRNGGFYDVAFSNCLFSGATATSPNTRGMDLQGAVNDVRVSNCRFWNYGDNGIQITESVSDVIITGCSFKFCSQKSSSGQGAIHIGATFTGRNIQIDNCIIDGRVSQGGAYAAGQGVRVVAATVNTMRVANCTIEFTAIGVYLAGGNGIEVSSCNIVNNTLPYSTTVFNPIPVNCIGYYEKDRGLVTLSGGTAVVTFRSPFPSTNFSVAITTNIAGETLRWSGRATSGFTITSSNTASTASVLWIAELYSLL